MTTLFSRIIRGEIPCEKIHENDTWFAFLDIRPISPGHTLVVPKFETDELFDLSADLLSQAMPFAKAIAQAIKKTVGCKRIGILVAGFEVPHAHIHLVPINHEGELSFSLAKAATREELSSMGQRIRSAL